MPFDEVMHKYGQGSLHSGGPSGPKVTNRKQAVAIMLSEKRKAQGGKTEYQSTSHTHMKDIPGNSMHPMVEMQEQCTVIDPKVGK